MYVALAVFGRPRSCSNKRSTLNTPAAENWRNMASVMFPVFVPARVEAVSTASVPNALTRHPTHERSQIAWAQTETYEYNLARVWPAFFPRELVAENKKTTQDTSCAAMGLQGNFSTSRLFI